MKKIFTLIAALMCVSALQANTYTDKLIVTVNGSSSQQNATITVDEKDGLATLSLKNFVLEAGGSKMGIGNIELKDLKVEKAGGQSILSTKLLKNIFFSLSLNLSYNLSKYNKYL